ncbi:DNA-binding GntR family transcriptional regulator [Peteryoungia aggregata LMG 23059]|uniref:DNA-binding GntR family transcriptional regulator n=1 Tax=Peteryoungia aggregata LMG 23059 TaxID=1368425 RepID=A0ABU0G5U3_9HYPH|nr:GntR family transcriptional regulator [Peteryoungia aggregata]MDQ0420709.1 DNA-binding GntR family transcriptional regulator [Peteryoungia aggregata LMG 23059]
MAKQNTVFKDAYNRTLKLIEETDTLPSEPELGGLLSVSRTTVRAVLTRLGEVGLVAWDKRSKTVLRRPVRNDYFPDEETNSLSDIIERSFMRRILAGGAQPGMQINELELAREIGIGTTSVREFLIRFSRFGLIEKRPNSHWVLKGFTREFALELTEVREMFELRSAASFVHLAEDHSAWDELRLVEAQHHALLADIDNRYMDFSELDERFHLLVQKASSNRFIIDFYDIITIVFHYHYQWNKTNARARNQRALEEHLDYISALFSRDAGKIEKACRQHLKSARETLLQSIQEPA